MARTYEYACWLCFLCAFFRMKDSTDFYDFWYASELSSFTSASLKAIVTVELAAQNAGQI